MDTALRILHERTTLRVDAAALVLGNVGSFATPVSE